MERLEINRTGNDHFSEKEKQQLEDALRILARMITRVILKERSLDERSQYEECHHSTERCYKFIDEGSSGEPLTLSVQAAAQMLGLSRASAYEAIRTGQIPSIRFGKRIAVPRAALNSMLSQAGNCKVDGVQ